jgi:hypothetical protein
MQETRCSGSIERFEARGGRRAQALFRSVGLLPLLALAACLDRPIGRVEPVTTNLFVDRITQTSVDKIDLLFMIDNSASMSDKQAILRLAVPDLVQRLVNPVCVGRDGRRGATPAPGAPCPEGQTREFEAIRDINVAVVSSSLGDAGAQKACSGLGGPGDVPNGVDMAHLMGSLPRGRDTGANAQGFLEWRAGDTNESAFSRNFENMVGSVGEEGCGWEASLESWYRFLVDPFPYRELVRVRCPGASSDRVSCVQPASDGSGQILLDDELLAQRAAFLRPDSLVAIIMLSDENDCSIQVGGQNWLVADTALRMPRASTACEQNPNDACCYMCGTQVPAGCAEDPVCEVEPEPRAGQGRLPLADDGVNLRCFEQKRRFGYDFLYPTSRYVNALSEFELCPSRPDLDPASCADNGRVQNPLFAGGRDKSLVFLGGIVGVPWQAIASDVDASGAPLADPDTTLRFKTAAELALDGTWAQILGSPGVPGGSRPVPPRNPLMIESDLPRAGVESGNPFNGREFSTVAVGARQDLEYACIFPLPEPRDCAEAGSSGACDCSQGNFDKPLCEERPGETPAGTVQHWAKAYPGIRQLQVLQDYGQNSIVASICARNVDIDTRDERPDFGYRPAVDSIVERLKERLGDRCLPRGLLTAEDDSVPCTLIESLPQPDTACVCDEAAARRTPDASTADFIRSQLVKDPSQPCGSDDPTCSRACLCEVLQVQEANPNPEEALRACREDIETPSVEGWCYVADTELQHIGNPELVAECPATSRRILRFVGQRLAANSTTFVACQGSSIAAQGDQ